MTKKTELATVAARDLQIIEYRAGLKPGTILRARKESWLVGREYIHVSPDGNPKPSSECMYNRRAIDAWIASQARKQPGA